jgi:hypothetical protein
MATQHSDGSNKIIELSRTEALDMVVKLTAQLSGVSVPYLMTGVCPCFTLHDAEDNKGLGRMTLVVKD